MAPQTVNSRSGDKHPELTAQLLARFEKEWKVYQRHFRRCQTRFSEVAVHGLRVSTRRLRSTCQLLSRLVDGDSARRVERRLKRAFRTVAPLRDHEVLLQQVNQRARRYRSLTTVKVQLRREVGKLEKRAKKRLGRIRLAKVEAVVKRLEKRARKSERHMAPSDQRAVLTGQARAAFATVLALFQQIDPDDSTTIHRTRVAFKKYRYIAEALQTELHLSDQVLERMHEYQTRMGAIQDVDVLLGYLGSLQLPEESRMALDQPRKELLRYRRDLIDQFMARRHALLEFRPRDK